MYSSGTTGAPKGVIITHAMLDFTASAAVRIGESGPADVTLNNMPLFHIGGLNVTALPSIWVGGTCVIMRLFDPDATIKAISNPDLGISVIFCVPAAYNAMRASALIETADFSRINVALCGAETVPEALINWWLEKGITIQEGYGMTETAAAGTFLRKADIPQRIGSAGRALMHSRVKIVDAAGEEVPRGTAGEIWFKGLSLTPGYWRNPKANAESFTDGWFHSGDIGIMDIKDPELRRKLTPDFPIGAKRVLLSDKIYPAFAKDTVEVVTEGIEGFTAEGLRTKDGKMRAHDLVVYATGFHTNPFLKRLDVRGVDGRALSEQWSDGASAYMGVMTEGFPNLFILYGPNTNTGHSSIIYKLENQVGYILQLMEKAQTQVAVKGEAEAEFADEMQSRLAELTWSKVEASWYKVGKKIPNNWPGGALEYKRRNKVPIWDHFEVS